MKRLPPSTHPSPSTSCSSSSSAIDDHLTTDRPLKQSKRPRKCADSTQCRAEGNPISDAKFSRRSSAYRGVTRHRWTGRFEAHLWDKSSYNCTQTKKGKQVYLGAYDTEEDAARTYDLAALKYWGLDTILNFPKENYTKEVEEMQNVSKQDYLASIRRSSSGFSRGVSKYRGVARHHHNGRWEARIGRVFGNKYLYLGTFSSQEEAAKAYDLAAIQYRGRNAVTNFDISNYIPKEEPEHDENPSSAIETKPDQLPPNQDQEQEEKHPPLISAQTSEESELVDTFNDSPVTLTDAFSWKNEPWSFCMDAGGYDPLCLPNVFHNEEEDSILFDRHVIHKEEEEEDSSLFYRRVFHEEEKDSNLFDLDVFRNEEEDLNLLDVHVFHSEKEDSILFDLHDSNLFDVLDEEDSTLFDVLDEKAFEDDIHLIYNDDEEGKWECVDGVEKELKEGCKMKEEKIDKSCFDSSSSSPSSSSTVTTDLF